MELGDSVLEDLTLRQPDVAVPGQITWCTDRRYPYTSKMVAMVTTHMKTCEELRPALPSDYSNKAGTWVSMLGLLIFDL